MNDPLNQTDHGPDSKKAKSSFFKDNWPTIVFLGFMLFTIVRCSQLQEKYDSPEEQAKRAEKLREVEKLGRALDRIEGRFAPEP